MTPNLFPRHKEALAQAARAPNHHAFTSRNDKLDEVIAQIKAERPEAFLTTADLKARCFVHTPPAREGQPPTRYARALRDRLSPFEVAERQVANQQVALLKRALQ